MGRRHVLALVVWLAAAAVAVLTGLAAVRIIGDGITSQAGAVRDAGEVSRALASAAPVVDWSSEPEARALDLDAGKPDPRPPGPGTVGAGPRRPTPAVAALPGGAVRHPAPTRTPSIRTGGTRPTPRASSAPGTRTAPPPVSPRPAATTTTLRTPGGTIVARCTGGQVELVSWAPAQGYATHAVDRGPDDAAEIRFRGDRDEVRVDVVCGPSGPAATWQVT